MNLNRIKTYCGKPIEVSRAGYLYPVRILEWEEFTKLAGRFLMTSDEFLRKRLKLEEEIKLFDFITLQAIMTSKTGFENLKEMEQLFSIVFRSEVKANLRGRVGNKEVYFIVDGRGLLIETIMKKFVLLLWNKIYYLTQLLQKPQNLKK